MNHIAYWVAKARNVNTLCIWPRGDALRAGYRARRAFYMSLARRAKAKAI